MTLPYAIIEVLKKHQHAFYPVVPFDGAKDKLLPLDFTSNNKELTGAILSDTKRFTAYIDQKLQKEKAFYGIGGYAEHRTVYSISKVFDAEKPGEEPRRLHLGTDIWVNGRLVMVYSKDGLNDVSNAKGCCCCGGNMIVEAVLVNVNVFTYALLY